MFPTLGVIHEMENGKNKQKIKRKLLEKQKNIIITKNCFKQTKGKI